MIGTGCIMGRAPHTKETLPDFCEWCRVTRHPRVFRMLTGCKRTPGFEVTQSVQVSEEKAVESSHSSSPGEHHQYPG